MELPQSVMEKAGGGVAFGGKVTCYFGACWV